MKNTNRLFIIAAALVGLTACDDSAYTSGSGYVYADKVSSTGNTFGNLYKSYTSNTSAYAEVKFQGQLGENSTGDSNWIVLPIWYKDSNHFYACILTEGDQGSLDPEIFVGGFYNDGTNSDSYIATAEPGKSMTDVFALTDTSEKTLGCELTTTAGVSKVSVYLNGVKYASYQIGSSANVADGTLDVADPGISGNGRSGFGLIDNWGTDRVKVNSFALFDKRPL